MRAQLSKTTDYTGITGKIAIDPKTGKRRVVPVVILDINKRGAYVVDPRWAKFAHFPLSSRTSPFAFVHGRSSTVAVVFAAVRLTNALRSASMAPR